MSLSSAELDLDFRLKLPLIMFTQEFTLAAQLAHDYVYSRLPTGTLAQELTLREFALAAWSLASLGLTPPVPWPHVQSGPTESGVTLFK